MTLENGELSDTQERVNFYNDNKNFKKGQRSGRNSIQSLKGSDG